jgi:hypothetical protein
MGITMQFPTDSLKGKNRVKRRWTGTILHPETEYGYFDLDIRERFPGGRCARPSRSAEGGFK